MTRPRRRASTRFRSRLEGSGADGVPARSYTESTWLVCPVAGSTLLICRTNASAIPFASPRAAAGSLSVTDSLMRFVFSTGAAWVTPATAPTERSTPALDTPARTTFSLGSMAVNVLMTRSKPATRSPEMSPLPIAALPTYKVLEAVYWWVRGVINQPAASAATTMARMSSSRRRRMERYRRSSMASAFDSVDGVVPTVPPAVLAIVHACVHEPVAPWRAPTTSGKSGCVRDSTISRHTALDLLPSAALGLPAAATTLSVSPAYRQWS